MYDSHSMLDSHLLALCAVLREFDPTLLRSLGYTDAAAVARLLTSDYVQPSAQDPARVVFADTTRRELLKLLRVNRPLDEVGLHAQVFTFFLGCLHQKSESSQLFDAESECFYHLEQLFILLGHRMEWQQLRQHLAAVHAVPIQTERHLHQVALYEGSVAIHTHDYALGEHILTMLLADGAVDRVIQMRASSSLGHMGMLQSHYDQALHWYQQQLNLAREIGDQVYEALALVNIGTIHNDLDQSALAYTYSEQSLRIFREQGEHVRIAYTLYAMGRNAMYLGWWQRAQQHFVESTEIAEPLELSALLIALYWAQGYTSHLLGDVATSEEWYQRALGLVRSGACEQPTVEMDTYLGLAFLYRAQGQWDKALACYGNASIVAQRLLKNHRLIQIEHQRGLVFEQQHDIERAAMAYQQAITLIETLGRLTKDENIKISLLGTIQQVYESMVLLCAARNQPDEAFNYAERARARALLDALMQNAPGMYDVLDQPIVTLAEVQSRLADDEVLIAYYTTGVRPRDDQLINKLAPQSAHLRQYLASPARVLIFVITQDQIALHDANLDPNTLRPQLDDPAPYQHFLKPRMLAILYDHLIAPVRDLLHGRRLLYLVPHGPLHYVPFNALCSKNGDYLVGSNAPAIAFAPSATILLRNCLNQQMERGSGFLALGYNGLGNDCLLYAESEAQFFAQIMGGQAWIGDAPKSSSLAHEGPRVRWLHIAGHAFYDPNNPLDSGLLLGDGDTLSARTIIQELRLNADLVTLNACASGLSRVVPGDEPLGLQRAFLYAGAPTIVCALWEVSDLIALLIMKTFYTSIRCGQSPAQALHNAQITIRSMTGRELAAIFEQWRAHPEQAKLFPDLPHVPPAMLDTLIYADPTDWAPFVLIGRP